MATCSDLPVEILEQILANLDNIDLYHVANVNRMLNYLALSRYFRRSGVEQPDCIDVSHMTMPLALRALCAAIWIKQVSNLSIHLNSDPTIFHQVRGLTCFIRRLDSLGALDLSIREPEYKFSGPCSREQNKFGNAWRKCFSTLLKAALSKGAKSVHIFEPASETEMLPGYIDMCHAPPLPWYWENWVVKRGITLFSDVCRGGGSNLESKELIIRLYRSRNTKIWGKASVKDIQLSPMQLTPLFYWDTLGLLGAHAHTIHTLNFAGIWSIFFYTTHWETLLTQLQFPALEQFTFTGFPGTVGHLLSFLNRHRKITHLELTSREWGRDPKMEEPPYLPNLKTLITHNYLAACILQRPGNCCYLEHLRLFPHSIYPPKSSVSRDDRWSPWSDVVLASIASHVTHPLKIEFELRTAIDPFLWIGGSADRRSTEIIRRLTQVHDIAISFGIFENIVRGMNFLLAVLPDWLALFPALKRLSVNIENLDTTAVLYTAIRNSCPHVQSLVVSNEIKPQCL